MMSILKAQAGPSRFLVTFMIQVPGERFGQRLTSHFSDEAEIRAKSSQLASENPGAVVTHRVINKPSTQPV